MYPHNNMTDRSVDTLFERFADLAAKMRAGEFTPAQFVEFNQLDELFRTVAFIAERQLRQVQSRVN